jgi:phosphatidylserine decarboxylase
MTHWAKRTLMYLLPHHALSRAAQWSARCPRFPLRRTLTRWFIRHYHVDMSEALVWAGEITPPRGKGIKVMDYSAGESALELQTGKELGRFNMGGSTIIVLFGPGRVAWEPDLGPGTRVRFGQRLGHVTRSTHGA